MVTMQQIADRCGVSRGTVDRALHHKEGVREEVAERIRATAREMGYISNRLVMQQTQQWKIGVVLHSGHSPFVQMLCELFESFSERELLPNITVIVRAMQDMDVQHQLTLIDELVTTEHIDGLALMPAREHARARQDQHAQRAAGHPCRDIQHGHHRCEPHRLCRRGQHRERPRRRRVARHGHAGARQRVADSGPAQRSLCRFAAFYRLQHRNGGEFSGYPGSAPGMARSSMKAFPSASLCAPFSRTASCAASI